MQWELHIGYFNSLPYIVTVVTANKYTTFTKIAITPCNNYMYNEDATIHTK